MKLYRLNPCRKWANKGHNAENAACDYLGIPYKRDNVKFSIAPDCGEWQVKGYNATVCMGLDLEAHMKQDAATKWMYVDEKFRGWEMNADEWKEFLAVWGYADKSSKGQDKLRIKKESRRLREWLEIKYMTQG